MVKESINKEIIEKSNLESKLDTNLNSRSSSHIYQNKIRPLLVYTFRAMLVTGTLYGLSQFLPENKSQGNNSKVEYTVPSIEKGYKL